MSIVNAMSMSVGESFRLKLSSLKIILMCSTFLCLMCFNSRISSLIFSQHLIEPLSLRVYKSLSLTLSSKMDGNLEDLQRNFLLEMEKLKAMEKKYQKMVKINKHLDTQLNENMMVQEELTLAKEDTKVFKLTGRVLVTQSLPEAKSHVEQRMKLIETESKRNNEEIDVMWQGIITQRGATGQLENQLQEKLMAAAFKTTP